MHRWKRAWLLVAALLVVTGNLSAGARRVPGHYVVFALDAEGRPQPQYHARVALAATAAGDVAAPALATWSDTAPLAQSGSVPTTQVQLSAGGNLHSLHLSGLVRGEFARAPELGDHAIDSVRLPLTPHTFVVRLPERTGIETTLSINGRPHRFRLADIAQQASALPLARLPLRPLAMKAAGFDPANRVDILVLGDGYVSSEREAFDRHADALQTSLLSMSPHREYASFLQFSRGFVASAQSGADHPPFRAGCTSASCCADSAASSDLRAGLFVDTAFDGRFCTSQSHRLLTVNYSKVLAAAAAYPDWDLVFVTVNDPVYGGSGGAISVSSAHEQAPKLVVHEFGHTFSGLADEYATPYPGYPACSDRGTVPARCEANVSDIALPGQVKWSGIPLTGLFEGARYQETGMFRPVNNCLMRALNAPLCPVCKQEFVLTLYRGGFGSPAGGIDLIEPGSESPPSNEPVQLVAGRPQGFAATLLQPEGSPVTVQWWLDGTLVHEGTAQFTYVPATALPAPRLLELRVTDPAPLVHGAQHAELLVHRRTWNLSVQAPAVSNGWYWSPSEPGRGYFFERKSDGGVFVGGFLYAPDGRSTWFTAQGRMPGSAREFLAPMNTFRDGQTLSGPWRAPTATPDLGQLSLQFGQDGSTRLRMPGTDMVLDRFPFATGSQLQDPQPGAPQSGWYWNPAEVGRGYAIEFQGDQVFLIAFLYAETGAPIWLLANGTMQSPTHYSGRWLHFADGQALGQPPRAPQLLTPDAGALSLDFPAADRARLTLPDGREIGLERFPF